MKHSLVAGLIAGGVCTALIAGCTSSSNGNNSSASKTLTVGISNAPTTLDPQLRDDHFERDIDQNIYETLLQRNDNNEIVPLLATALPKAIGQTKWEFTLRTGVTYTNGEAFNAADVVYSIQRITDPKFATTQGDFFAGITGATAVNDTTVDIETKTFDPLLPAQMTEITMVPQKYSTDSKFATAPIGTGPYMMGQYVSGQYAKLTANPKYWGTKPKIENVTVQFIGDQSTRLSALKTGQIELMDQLPPDLKSQAPKAIEVPGIQNQTVVLDTQAGITKNPLVRQALNLAVNKDAIVNDLFDGAAVVSKCQIVAPSAFGYNSSLQAYPYDVAKAKSLLQQAGVEGQTIQLMGASGSVFPQGEAIVQAIASDWQAVGLKVKITNLPLQGYLNSGLYAVPGKGRPEGVYLQTSTDFLDASTPFNQYIVQGTGGHSVYENSTVDSQIAQADSSSDPAQRQSLLGNAIKQVCTDAPFVFLSTTNDVYGSSTNLQFTPRADAALLFADMSFS